MNVGGLGMNTGGYARLSISFFSDSESIHRKTRIAGETMTKTDSQNPTLRSHAPGTPARSAGTRCRGRGHVHLVFSRTCRSNSASASTMTKNTTTTADAEPML